MIGELKKRITVQEVVETPDGGGGFTDAWQSISTNPDLYASITPLSSGESLKFHQLENSATHKIIIRYRDDLTTSMRILNGTTVYDINAIADIKGRNEYLEILTTLKE